MKVTKHFDLVKSKYFYSVEKVASLSKTELVWSRNQPSATLGANHTSAFNSLGGP